MNPYAPSNYHHHHQQQQQQQQAGGSSSSHSSGFNPYHQQPQPQQHNNVIPGAASPMDVGGGQQQQQQHILPLVQQLQSRLAEEEETNFDLKVEVATLQAELQNSQKTLEAKAAAEKSKWEHELRLAQQEAQKWKLKFQKQQQYQHQFSTPPPPPPPPPTTTATAVGNKDEEEPQQQHGYHPNYHQHDETILNDQQHHPHFAPPPQLAHQDDHQQKFHQQQLHVELLQHQQQSNHQQHHQQSSLNLPATPSIHSHINYRNVDDGYNNDDTIQKSNEVPIHPNRSLTRDGNIAGLTTQAARPGVDSSSRMDVDDGDATYVQTNDRKARAGGTNTTPSRRTPPVQRLAMTLLFQVPEHLEAEDNDEEGQVESKPDEPPSQERNQTKMNDNTFTTCTSTLRATPPSNTHNNHDNRMIRRVLMNIAFSNNDDIDISTENDDNEDMMTSSPHVDDGILRPSKVSLEPTWTESSLVGWLIVQSLISMKNSSSSSSSSSSQLSSTVPVSGESHRCPNHPSLSSSLADLYVYKALLQSPTARRYILEQILHLNTSSDPQVKARQIGGRRRKVRIHPISDSKVATTSFGPSDQQLTSEYLDRIRKSLLNPWCELPVTTTKLSSSAHRSGSRHMDDDVTSSTSVEILYEWIHHLSSSWASLHLQILQILVDQHNTMGLPNDVWWGDVTTTSMPETTRHNSILSIITTIQTMVHRRLYQQRHNDRSSNSSTMTSAVASSGRGSKSQRVNKNPSLDSNGRNGSSRIVLPYRFHLDAIAPAFYTTKDTASTTNKAAIKQYKIRDPLFTGYEMSDDETFALALSVLKSMISVSSFSKLEEWYRSSVGIHKIGDNDVEDDEDKVKDNGKIATENVDANDNEHNVVMIDTERDVKKRAPSNRIPGGIFLVSILVELLEGLQFLEWSKDENALASVHLHSIDTKMNIGPNDLVLPKWYYPIVELFMTIGRTYAGMKVLRTRLPDFKDYDWMGNALDVSIRHLHVLVQFWDSVDLLQPSMILRLGPIDHDGPCSGLNQTRARKQVGRVIEMWVRFWHQILLYIAKYDKGSYPGVNGQTLPNEKQSDRDEACRVAFRSLFVDVQGWLTSAYAVLMNSTDTRPEIKSMIWQQLQELSLDEEEREDSKQ